MDVFIDKSFDINNLTNYSLSLKVGDNFFIANALKTKSSTHIAIAEHDFQSGLEEGFKINAFIETLKKSPVKISKKYNEVFLSVANTHFAVIPKALFDASHVKAYVNLNTKVPENFVYKSKAFEKEGIIVCYAIPKELNDWTKKVFPKAKISHDLAVGLQSIIRDFYSASEKKVILNVHKNYFDFIYLKNGKLNFVNSFSYSEKEDFLYFVLFTAEQLEINPLEIDTYLLGEIKTGSETHQLLFQYIKNLHFGNRNKNIKLAAGLNEIPKHYFYTTFNQHLCG